VQTLLHPELVTRLNERFERAAPQDVVRWALTESGLDRVALVSSFQDEAVALIHMAVQVRSDVPVIFLETGFHFAETLAFKEQLTERLGLNIWELTGEETVESQAAAYGPRLYETQPNLCCEINKVRPLNAALRTLDAWLTGLRRDSAPTRAGTPIVDQYELEAGKTLVRISPLANWRKRDVVEYLAEQDLPRHPLYRLGFASIGCAPCTRALFPGEDERAGRWPGAEKVECGIHLGPAKPASG
jgi:phosphoadenosine phosphosulfate reductase